MFPSSSSPRQAYWTGITIGFVMGVVFMIMVSLP